MKIRDRRRERLQAARAWVLANPHASISETMAATGVSSTTVNKVRKSLIADGLVLPYSHTTGAKPKGPGLVAAPVVQLENPDADAEAVLAGTMPLTKEQRRQKLEFFIRHGQPDHAIRANAELTKMEKEEGKKDEIGPGPPQTLDDAIGCASDIIEALCAWGGEKAVKRAVTLGMETFFREQKKKQEGDKNDSGPAMVDSQSRGVENADEKNRGSATAVYEPGAQSA